MLKVVKTRLSAIESKLVSRLQFDASGSTQEIAKTLGIKGDTARYAIRRLIARGILTPATWIDVHPLGLMTFGIFFSLTSQGQSIRERVLDDLLHSDKVSFLAELGGEFQFAMSICVAGVEELEEFIEQLTTKFKQPFFARSIALRLRLVEYPLRIIGSTERPGAYVSWGVSHARVTIDETDCQILSTLSNTQLTSPSELAEHLGVARSTIEYRMKKLTECGVIIRSRYFVNTKLLNLHAFMITLTMRGATAAFRDALVKFCSTQPNLRYVVQNMGAWDFELGVEVVDADELPKIVEALYGQFGEALNSVQVLPVLRYLKVANYPFKVPRTNQQF